MTSIGAMINAVLLVALRDPLPQPVGMPPRMSTSAMTEAKGRRRAAICFGGCCGELVGLGSHDCLSHGKSAVEDRSLSGHSLVAHAERPFPAKSSHRLWFPVRKSIFGEAKLGLHG